MTTDTITRQSNTQIVDYTGPLMACLPQNICSQKFTGFENGKFRDHGNPPVAFSFLAMLFAVQNSSSFTVWFKHGEFIWTKTENQKLRDKTEDWGLARLYHRRRRQKLFFYLLESPTHSNIHSTRHMLPHSKHASKVKTRNFFLACWKGILSKKQIIISQRARWVVAALPTLLGNPSYFLLFLPRTQTRAV